LTQLLARHAQDFVFWLVCFLRLAEILQSCADMGQLATSFFFINLSLEILLRRTWVIAADIQVT
jgi:hypothetical protein